MRGPFLPLLIVVSALAACRGDTVFRLVPQATVYGTIVEAQIPRHRVDVLYVVDVPGEGVREEWRGGLAALFGAQLNEGTDMRAALITSQASTCGEPEPGACGELVAFADGARWLTSLKASEVENITRFAGALDRLPVPRGPAELLEAAAKALEQDARQPAGQRFARDGVPLVLVFITPRPEASGGDADVGAWRSRLDAVRAPALVRVQTATAARREGDVLVAATCASGPFSGAESNGRLLSFARTYSFFHESSLCDDWRAGLLAPYAVVVDYVSWVTIPKHVPGLDPELIKVEVRYDDEPWQTLRFLSSAGGGEKGWYKSREDAVIYFAGYRLSPGFAYRITQVEPAP